MNIKKLLFLFLFMSTVQVFSQTYKKDDKVQIEWSGKWYPGVILEVNKDKYKIHYDDYSSSWDDWVPASRLKPVAAAETTKVNTTTIQEQTSDPQKQISTANEGTNSTAPKLIKEEKLKDTTITNLGGLSGQISIYKFSYDDNLTGAAVQLKSDRQWYAIVGNKFFGAYSKEEIIKLAWQLAKHPENTPHDLRMLPANAGTQASVSSSGGSKNSSTNTNTSPSGNSTNDGKVVYSYTKNGAAITECDCINNPPQELWVSIPLPPRAFFNYADIQVEIFANKPYGGQKQGTWDFVPKYDLKNDDQQEYISMGRWSSYRIVKSEMPTLNLQLIRPKEQANFSADYYFSQKVYQRTLCSCIKNYNLYLKVIGYNITGTSEELRIRGSYEKYYETVTNWDSGTLLLDKSNKLNVIANTEWGKQDIKK